MARANRVQRRLFGIIAAGALFVVIGVSTGIQPVREVFAVIGQPFATFLSNVSAGASSWLNVGGSIGQLAKENQQLRAEVAGLRQRLSQETEIKAQNEELRKQLNVGSVRPDRLIAAEVIGYQPDNFRQFVTIGRGKSDGIEEGMAVVSQGALVGTVQEVTNTTARVFLVIDPNFRVTGLDQDSPGRPTGTVRGQIGNGLIMDKIAQTEEIKPGNTIVTTGTGNEIPKGLIIGRIQTVDRKDNGVFQTAQLTSSVAFNRLEVVYVVARQ